MFFPLRLIMHWPSKLILSLCWFWRQNLFGETLENFSKVNGNRYVYNCNSKLKVYISTRIVFYAFRRYLTSLSTWSISSWAIIVQKSPCLFPGIDGSLLIPHLISRLISLCFILQMWPMARSTDFIADLRCDVWSHSSIRQQNSKLSLFEQDFLVPIQVTLDQNRI